MKIFCDAFVYMVIGVLPVILAGYGVADWQWWSSCVPLWIGIRLRDFANK